MYECNQTADNQYHHIIDIQLQNHLKKIINRLSKNKNLFECKYIILSKQTKNKRNRCLYSTRK